MTTTLDSLPKPAKELPDEAKEMWVSEYNKDFGWRCSESHAEKAAWRKVQRHFRQTDEGWVKR